MLHSLKYPRWRIRTGIPSSMLPMGRRLNDGSRRMLTATVTTHVSPLPEGRGSAAAAPALPPEAVVVGCSAPPTGGGGSWLPACSGDDAAEAGGDEGAAAGTGTGHVG